MSQPTDFAPIKLQLQQLMTAGAYALWVATYITGQGRKESDVVLANLAASGASVQLTAAAMLEALHSLAGGASRIKIGPLDITRTPDQYRTQAANLRLLHRQSGSGNRWDTPLASISTGTTPALPPAFVMTSGGNNCWQGWDRSEIPAELPQGCP